MISSDKAARIDKVDSTYIYIYICDRYDRQGR